MSINKRYWAIEAISAALVVSNSTSAGLVGVDWQVSPDQHPDGQHKTWRIIAIFNDANDTLKGVEGLSAGIDTLDFKTSNGSDIYNQALYDGLPRNDFPSVGIGGEAYDSYVTIGDTMFPHNTQFTDDFMGDWGGNPPPIQVIQGSSFYGPGGWFYVGNPPPVSFFDIIPDNDTFDVVIAQFTVDMGVNIHLQGNIVWQNDGGGDNATPFSVTTPAPGALALFGIAAFTTTRRRRR